MESRLGLSLLGTSGRFAGCKPPACTLKVVLAGLLLLASEAGIAKVYEKREHALERVFGEETVLARHTAFLTVAQQDSVRKLARAALPEARINYYTAVRNDSVVGHAYLDTHIVRSLYETLMIVVDRSGQLQAVEVLAFHEPADYRPPKRWFQKLLGRDLSHRLRPGDDVDAISGATLSVRAASEAVRRVLAVHSILHGDSR